MSLATGIVAVGVVWFIVGLWRIGVDVPTVTSSSFTVCGQTYELQPGYLAFNYGSRGNAEVPEGHTNFNVRSIEPGVAPPDDVADIFRVWPTEISELVVGDPYRDLLESVDLQRDVDPDWTGTGTRLEHIVYPDGCGVSVSLDAINGTAYPRPGDWAIGLYESLPSTTDAQ